MATYLELAWRGLDATVSENTNSDPATGEFQKDQLKALNKIFAVLLSDSDGSGLTYAVSTVFSTRYRALADVGSYMTGDILQRDRVYAYATQEFVTFWMNVTQETDISEPLADKIVAISAEVVTQHTDEREVSLPGNDTETLSRAYTIDINSPAVIASDSGWQ